MTFSKEIKSMKAVYYEKFQGPVEVRDVPKPDAGAGSVVVKVEATGLCRSDWHGWMGHDSDIRLPHVPGHELAGVVVKTGEGVKNWKPGDRVTVPFVGGCGHCPECNSGNHQVCDHQFQPGFTAWGSFAEFVEIQYADTNLVRLPDEMSFETAASLGCRFITSFRAVVLNAREINDIPTALQKASGRGAHISIDALGSQETCFNSVACLRKRGKHIQVGLMTGDHRHPKIPMDKVVANELEIIGSHGMQAFRYNEMFEMIHSGKLNPELLLGKTISLEEAPQALMDMNKFENTGVTVINRF